MDKKTKTRRLKMTLLTALILPVMAIGISQKKMDASCNSNEEERICVQKEKLYGATYPSTLYTGYAASDVDYYEQPDFVRDYFKNLTDYFPTNNCGNCGYTAATMLLCYYDTYWNGSIIPPHLNSDICVIGTSWNDDYSSPGVNDFAAPVKLDGIEEPKEGASEQEWKRYNGFIYDEIYAPYVNEMLQPEHLRDNFMSFLYDIALGNNYWGTRIWEFGIDHPTPGLNGDQVKNLLNLYFAQLGLSDYIEAKTISYFDLTSFPDQAAQRKELRRLAVERLEVGQPLIYMGDLFTESSYYDKYLAFKRGRGHFSIAYSYDKFKDQIIGHLGWKGEKRQYSIVPLEEAYGDFDAFLYLDVKDDLPYTEWNQRFATTHAITSCGLASHSHASYFDMAAIDYGDNEFHALQCICGDVKYQKHYIAETVWYDSVHYAEICRCGRIMNQY